MKMKTENAIDILGNAKFTEEQKLLHYLDFFLPGALIYSIDSYPLFSCASRKRVYVTNLNGYRGKLEKLAPTHVPNLRECLNLNEADEWPHWFEHVYPEASAHPCVTTSLFRSEDSVSEISKDLITNLKKEAKGLQTKEETIEKMKAHKHRVREHFLMPAGADCPFGTIMPLPEDAAEQILGFEAGHTSLRAEGVTTQSRFARRKHLGNSFQCDTVAALLSPLKDAQDRGDIGPINVLSLFDGIGGAAVALVKAGIKVAVRYECTKYICV